MTGYLPEEIMKHEYYLEWQRINEIVEKFPDLILDKEVYDEKIRQYEMIVSNYYNDISPEKGGNNE